MATPSPATPLPTRQQLDEIDALLRRMLTLPPLAGEPVTPPASPVSAAPARTYPAPTVREVPPPRDPLPAEPVVREWRVEWPPAAAPTSSSVVAWGSPVPAGPPAEEPMPSFATPAYGVPAAADPVPFAAAMPGQPAPSAAVPPPSLPVQFLVLLNGTFDVLTYLLGPLGTWLRGSGRSALGWAGVLLLAAAAAWAAGEWAGYEWPAIDLSRLGGPKFDR